MPEADQAVADTAAATIARRLITKAMSFSVRAGQGLENQVTG
jgi:hypothetical protein